MSKPSEIINKKVLEFGEKTAQAWISAIVSYLDEEWEEKEKKQQSGS